MNPSSEGLTTIRTTKRVYAWTLAGIILWLAAVFAAPVLISVPGGTRLGVFLYTVFSPVCHQHPGRCFSLGAYPLAVCARCLGIYSGFLLGTIAFPFIRSLGRRTEMPGLPAFLLFSLPIGLDFAANVAGLWASPNPVRLAVGLIWGSLLPFYWIPGLGEAVGRLRRPGARA